MSGLAGELSGFVGRRAETADAKRLLGASRLVTLTGPGGVGKTRLALHVARGLRRAFPDGVWFVDLSVIEDPGLVPQAMAAALELPDTSGADVTAVLEATLADVSPLIVLDNCEQVVAAAAALVDRLLSGAPGLRFLVTSREALGIPGEHLMSVAPMSLPDGPVATLGRAMASDAVALLVERASAVEPSFRLTAENHDAVVRLCRRLDGLPLAIELAAARVRVLSVEEILARLDTRFELLTSGVRTAPARQQTLEAAVAWSFDLCPEPEQALWARLSVFSGGFDLEAAEEVAGGDVLGGLASLVNKSVLLRESAGDRARYRMLETIRTFGRRRLAERGEETDLRRRHRDHYQALAAQGEMAWFGPGQADRLEQCRSDLPDLWAAMTFSLGEPGEEDAGADLAFRLWWFWITRAVRDGRHWLDRALSVQSDASARVGWVDGWLAIAHGDAPGATRLLGGPADGVPVLHQAVVDYRTVGTFDATAGLAWCNLPTVSALLGDPDSALELCQDWIDMCESAGEEWARSWALWVLAILRWRRDEAALAQEHAEESLRLKWSLRDQIGTPAALALLAMLATGRGDAKQAAFQFGALEALWEPLGRPAFGWGTFRDWAEQWRARTTSALGTREFESVYAAGRESDLDAVIALALGETGAVPAERAASPELGQLTRRELEVAKLVAEGLSNKEIAAALVISQRTAETHVANILDKLGFSSRAQVAVWITRL